MDIRQIKQVFAKTSTVNDLLTRKANWEDLHAIRDSINAMPTKASMDLKFKQVSNDMDNLTVRLRKMFVIKESHI